ncbi:inhibitor of growth protein 5-like [Ictidomys tridecemlineatus]|nr:inhibitor of growth protein 5-like [Ictidomys tridecemlineatus]
MFVSGIENLPCELQRNFQLMRELDQRTEDKKAEIDLLAAEYISTVKTLSPDQRVAHLQKIQSAYSKCKEYSDDKVQLAMQTYEMVRLWVLGGGSWGTARWASLSMWVHAV